MNINNRIKVKPSKQASVGGLIVAIGMFVFALVFFGAVSGDMDSDAAMPVSIFFVIFIIAILVIIVYYAYNLFSKKGIAILEIDSDVESKDEQKSVVIENPETRLKKLEELKEKELISDDEYKQQREEIIKSI